jgi:alginate O-acetyltransferase complex protein AlgI
MNFNHPYFAKSIREFWTRWHISLSNWFRDYVYIPIGGSRKGKLYGMFALTLTMLLSGIWHGANYTFIAWASLHVIYLLIERQTNWYKRFKRIPYLLTILIFIQVTLAWIFFRAVSIDQAFNIVGRLVSFKPSNLDFFNTYLTGIVFLILAIIIEMATYSRKNFSPIKRFYRSNKNTFEYTLLTLCILCIVFFRGEGTQFIYFQF